MINKALAGKTNDPELMQLGYYYSFADLFGWTPDKVDQLDCYIADALLHIASHKNKEGETSNRKFKKWHLT